MSAVARAPAPRPQGRRRTPAGRGPAGPAGTGPGPRRPAGGGADERDRLRRLATGFVRAFLEVECGRRTRTQLHPVLCPDLAARLAHVWVRGGPPGHVVCVHGVRTAPDRYEAVAIVRRGERFGAVVVTLRRVGPGWRVVDAARPEDTTGHS